MSGFRFGYLAVPVCVVPVVGFNLRLRVLSVHSLCGYCRGDSARGCGCVL